MISRRRALLSVTDKTGVAQFGKALVERGFELISTGGTAKELRDSGLTVIDISEVTGSPEMLDGRVKTLHPLVHGALLGDTHNPAHVATMNERGIVPIEIVAVNLYQFENTISKDHTFDEAVESIDIGGPAMIRSSAKNHASVAIIVEPSDYDMVVAALDTNTLADLRPSLAAKAFRHTAYYDSVISQYMTKASGGSLLSSESLTFGYRHVQGFRYGENPHQAGALFASPGNAGGLPHAKQHWGKELSYNNINDANGAWELVGDMPEGSCAIIKHSNPCGAAVGSDLGDSYRMARESDPISAFGGIAAFNQVVGVEAATAMCEKGNFLEVVIAPGYTVEALEIFKSRSGWGQDVRLIEALLPTSTPYLSVKTVRGGAIIQESDENPVIDWRVVTEVQPTESQLRAMKLQWAIVQHVKSNAIVIGGEHALYGVGAGQMNRVQSVGLAAKQAGEKSKGAVLASDAFFPFPDSIELAHSHGIAAIVQPGGSKKDPDVIAKANELGISMCLTGIRHFNH